MLAIEQAEWCGGGVPDVTGELPFPGTSVLVLRDDAVLDHWIASLTADQFERVLHSLARPRTASSAGVSAG